MSAAAEFLLTLVGCSSAAAAMYAAALLGTDALLQARAARRRHRAELNRINDEAALAVQRIGDAFAVAQQLIRDEATTVRGSHQ